MNSRKSGLFAGLLVAVLPAAVACGPTYDTIGQLDGVRVLGVEKSQPTPAPGETVELHMIVHDTGPVSAESKRAPLQVAWLSGCTNPPTDLYQGCFAQLAPRLAKAGVTSDAAFSDPNQALQTLLKLAEVGVGFGVGPEFSFQVPEDVISSRQEFRGVDPYGVSYVFFAACAGKLVPDQVGGTFPLRCVNEAGETLGPREFVAGYTSLFSYEAFQNRNPVLLGFEKVTRNQKLQVTERAPIEGSHVCIGNECSDLPWNSSRECDGSEPEVSRCKDASQAFNCPKLDFAVKFDGSSVDGDLLASRQLAEDVTEQVWVNYHTDRGQFGGDLSLLNDPKTGLISDVAGRYLAPENTGKAHVWTVLRDNRGGTAWGRFDICVTE